MSQLDLALSKDREGFTLAIQDSFSLAGITGIFGPSGSGKTTLLRLIAGLERPDSGCLIHNGQIWAEPAKRRFRSPAQRPVAMVFQEPRLFPHLSVRANLLYGCNGRPPPDFSELVRRLGLTALLSRRPAGLSGGEAQRVALGRALLRQPALLLCDEPVSALDAAARSAALALIAELARDRAVPVLYVSHSVPEMLSLTDRILILDQGHLRAQGPTVATLNAHAGQAAGSLVEAQVQTVDTGQGLTWLDSPCGVWRLGRSDLTPGSRHRLRILPQDIALALSDPKDTSILNGFHGVIETIYAHGDCCLVTLCCGTGRLTAQISRYSASTLGLTTGMAAVALIKAAAIERYDAPGSANEPSDN